MHRFFTAAYDLPYFDRSRDGRLNAPDGSYGVLYTAKEVRGALAETFLREPGRSLIPSDLLARKAYVKFQVTRPLLFIKLGGPGLARLGATAELVHGGLPYDVPQAWSASLHNHPVEADGIAYYARHDNEALCYALFDNGPTPVEEKQRVTDLDQDWFWEFAGPYGVGLAP
ncbi:RES family NAD+ phosphorylase [Microvirga sp. GCM10011540]|uniref:RES family NAD+ phosphorylase n=1 Tax=Microvirga sp. GCM10011540 TaxID=3317338 RepID=UPI0036118D9A